MNDLYSKIQVAAHAGAFGLNGYPLPTVEQCRAGNYKKGRVKLYGLDIAIETPQGAQRMGKSDGKPWSVICMAHYGDISGTRGADGDPVDCYIGPIPESDRVFVVNQNGKNGDFDEHKVMLAFADEESARTAYMNSYERGWNGLGSLVSASVSQFRWWLKYGNTTLPFSKNALPYSGEDDMNEITWDSAAQPVNSDLATVMYGLRHSDADGLLLDAVTMADLLEDSEGHEILDALVIENVKLPVKMGQLQSIMEAAGTTLKPVAMQITDPYKQRGTTNVTVLFELSDGQTVAIFFHNPDSTPNKILPQDELVSWKWLLNKKDVTILVAPEKGRDLNPREVARRIMKLAERNSAKFVKANTARAERMASIEQARGDISSKEGVLAALDAEIIDLTAQVEAKRAAPPSPPVEPAPEPVPATPPAPTELTYSKAIRDLGEATITEIGEGNVYVEKDGARYFFNSTNPERYAVGAHDFTNDLTFANLGSPEDDAEFAAFLAQLNAAITAEDPEAINALMKNAANVRGYRAEQVQELVNSHLNREPAPKQANNDELEAACALLRSVIDGTANMDAGLADRLQAVHDLFSENAEFATLFEQAAHAFSDAMIAKAKQALPA